MKNPARFLSFVMLAAMALSIVGCSSEPADEPAAAPTTTAAGTGKFQAGVDSSGAGGAAQASPFRSNK